MSAQKITEREKKILLINIGLIINATGKKIHVIIHIVYVLYYSVHCMEIDQIFCYD